MSIIHYLLVGLCLNVLIGAFMGYAFSGSRMTDSDVQGYGCVILLTTIAWPITVTLLSIWAIYSLVRWLSNLGKPKRRR